MIDIVKKLAIGVLPFAFAAFLIGTLLYNNELQTVVRYDQSICANRSPGYDNRNIKSTDVCLRSSDAKTVDTYNVVTQSGAWLFGLSLAIVLLMNRKRPPST